MIEDKDTDWDEVEKLFKDRFCKSDDMMFIMHQLQTFQMLNDESVTLYTERFMLFANNVVLSDEQKFN